MGECSYFSPGLGWQGTTPIGTIDLVFRRASQPESSSGGITFILEQFYWKFVKVKLTAGLHVILQVIT